MEGMNAQFNVGDRVIIKGDSSDFTDALDGRMGTVVQVRSGDCLVMVDDDIMPMIPWCVWKYNLSKVIEGEVKQEVPALEDHRCMTCKNRYPKDFQMFCPHRIGPVSPDGTCEHWK